MKILVYDTAYAPAAFAVRITVIKKIKGWQRKGARITLICSTEAKNFYQKELLDVEFLTFPLTWRSKGPWTAPFECLRANFLIFPFIFKVKGKFDIVYSHTSTLDMIFFAFVLRLVDRKVRWFSIVDNIVPRPSERPGNYILKLIPYLAFLISNHLLRKTDGIFVVTGMLKKYYEKMGIRVIKTGIGNGLDIESFWGGISRGTPHFNALFGGRIHPAKGIFDLAAIMKRIVMYNKNFTLGIMGDGEEAMKKKLNQLIKNNHLSKNIFLIGYKSAKERWDLYRNSDFFLFPSYAEGCPQIVLEAFAANKLVVAYDLPEYRDAFKKYLKSGQLIIFKKGETEAIVKYILSLKNLKFNFHNQLKDYGWEKIINNEWKTFCKELS